MPYYYHLGQLEQVDSLLTMQDLRFIKIRKWLSGL